MWPFKNPDVVYRYLMYYGFKVETNYTVRIHSDSVVMIARNDEEAERWFKKQNPNVILTGFINDGPL